MTKTSYNFQKLENYSTSTATINNAELKTISVVDYVFNQFVGNTFSTSSIGPGVTKTISEIPTVVTTQIFGAVPGVYQLTLTKNKTSGARTFGGVWWLDEEYYNQTH